MTPRPMHRQDRQLPQEEAWALLTQGTYGVLSVVGDEGWPYAVPMHYTVMDGQIYLHCAKTGYKLDAIARDGYVAVSGWKELSAEKGVDFCRRLRDAGVQTVIYTDISRDGAEQGTNLALYRELAKIEGLDITASGGVSSLEELRELRKIGAKAAILGKALYTGRLDLKTVIREVGAC